MAALHAWPPKRCYSNDWRRGPCGPSRADWRAFWFLGKAYEALGHKNTSNWNFRAAFELHPRDPNVAREYGISCVELGLGPEAVRAAEEAVALSPNEAGLYANLALAYLIASLDHQALVAINKALDMDRKDQTSQNVKEYVDDVLAGRKPRPRSGADFQ